MQKVFLFYHHLWVTLYGPPCNSCDKKFITEVHLREHRLFVHDENKDFLCNICDRESSSPQNLKRHISKNHDFQCKACAKKFVMESHLKEHTSLVHDLVAYGEYDRLQCKNCDRKFNNLSNVRKHESLFCHFLLYRYYLK